MSKGEDGRLTIKWRRKPSVSNAGEEIETEEIRRIAETEASVDTETRVSLDVETEECRS